MDSPDLMWVDWSGHVRRSRLFNLFYTHFVPQYRFRNSSSGALQEKDCTMIWRSWALLLVIAIGSLGAVPDARAQAKSQANEKYASLVMDAETGVILSSRYADSPRHPASLVKMMTLLMVFEALERGDLKLKDRIRISQHAASMQPSKLGLKAGSTIRVEDAMLALITRSANDIAAAVGEHLGGTESRFALNMTRRAHDIGMTKTTFRNASGLPHSGQITTARDMAKLAHYILHRYPQYYSYFSTRTFTYQGQTYRNHNRLMESYQGMDGFKTGYINASGFNLVASARRDGRRLIGVVFGGRTTASRNAHMADIMNAGFEKIGKGDVRGAQIMHATIAKPPIPTRKPGILVAQAIMQPAPQQIASLTPLQAQAMRTPADNDNVVRQLVRIQPELQSGAYDELTGQGDFDQAVTKRLETGMLAMAVHKNKMNPNARAAVPVSLPPAATTAQQGNWSVQIGAFNSRVSTDDALRRAVQSLPAGLKKAQPLVVPMRAGNNNNGQIMFRARLAGFNEEEARTACRYLRDCLVISPR